MKIVAAPFGLLALALSGLVTASPVTNEARAPANVTAELDQYLAHPLVFCEYYLNEPRNKSPIIAFTPKNLTKTCNHFLHEKGVTEKHKKHTGKPIGSLPNNTICDKGSAFFLGGEFRYPVQFCDFFNAKPRNYSPFKELNVTEVKKGCICFPDDEPYLSGWAN